LRLSKVKLLMARGFSGWGSVHTSKRVWMRGMYDKNKVNWTVPENAGMKIGVIR